MFHFVAYYPYRMHVYYVLLLLLLTINCTLKIKQYLSLQYICVRSNRFAQTTETLNAFYVCYTYRQRYLTFLTPIRSDRNKRLNVNGMLESGFHFLYGQCTQQRLQYNIHQITVKKHAPHFAQSHTIKAICVRNCLRCTVRCERVNPNCKKKNKSDIPN